MSELTNVAFLGLGHMGGPMAANLVEGRVHGAPASTWCPPRSSRPPKNGVTVVGSGARRRPPAPTS